MKKTIQFTCEDCKTVFGFASVKEAAALETHHILHKGCPDCNPSDEAGILKANLRTMRRIYGEKYPDVADMIAEIILGIKPEEDS